MKELKDTPPGSSKSPNSYDELWNLEKSNAAPQEAPSGSRALPPEPEKDKVWSIQQYSTVLEE